MKTPGALQPLPIPTTIWMDISMDFISSLMKAYKKSIIMVVVDWFSKYYHFYALQHSFTLANAA